MNRVIVWIAIALVLGGCAFGRTYSYGDASMGMPGLASGSGTVALAVHDVRPYVVSGNKPERFVGLMRGGFGNPFDVNTGSGDALSNDLRRVISKALQSKGYKVTDVLVRPTETPAAARRRALEPKARRSIIVTLSEWKSDTMVNTSIYYDVELVVLDERGEPLASNQMRGTDNLGGMGIAPEGAITATFARKLDALFDNERRLRSVAPTIKSTSHAASPPR